MCEGYKFCDAVIPINIDITRLLVEQKCYFFFQENKHMIPGEMKSNQ